MFCLHLSESSWSKSIRFRCSLILVRVIRSADDGKSEIAMIFQQNQILFYQKDPHSGFCRCSAAELDVAVVAVPPVLHHQISAVLMARHAVI